MSELALAEPYTPPHEADDELVRTWRERIQQARDDRARYEPGWLSSLAFAAGKQHLVWDRTERRLYLPELNDGEERYTADKITQYRTTAQGELTSDDDRPEVQFRRDDLRSEEYARQVNEALEYGWEVEFDADARLADVKRIMVDLGTAAVRCRWDQNAGPLRVDPQTGEPIMFPHRDGKPILDPDEAREYVLAQFQAGRGASLKPLHEGRIVWEVLTPFNLLVPPGITDPQDFPWEIVVRPVPLDKVKAEYGAKAADLKEDSDIGVVFGLGTREFGDYAASQVDEDSGQAGKLRNHVWLFTGYQAPTKERPDGQKVVLASSALTLLETTNELPYRGPDMTPRSGISYFHWWRITGRFWGKSLIEGLKDPQRSINRRATQKNEIIDRGMPFAIEEEGAIIPRQGKPLETVKVKPGSAKPEFHGGIGAGDWMYRDLNELRQDMEEAAGIRSVSLGDNPASVTNFSQLALLRENDQIKLRPTVQGTRLGVKRIVEDTIYDMRAYWGPDKQVHLGGDEHILRSQLFDATKIPAFFLVKIAKGAPKPHSQAAQFQMIQDVARFSVESGQPLPTTWLAESLKSGQLQPLPETADADQRMKAQHENLLMTAGKPVPVAYYDPPLIHIPTHRSLQIQAELAGDMELWQMLEQHVQEHLAVEEAKAAEQAAGAPPGTVPPPA